MFEKMNIPMFSRTRITMLFYFPFLIVQVDILVNRSRSFKHICFNYMLYIGEFLFVGYRTPNFCLSPVVNILFEKVGNFRTFKGTPLVYRALFIMLD